MTQGLGLDEHVQIIRLAAIAQGRVTKGGRLLVTNHRALSARGRSTGYSGARDVSIPRSQVAEVRVAPRSRRLLDGGLRRRLVIRLRDDTEHLFVVNRAEALATTLRCELL